MKFLNSLLLSAVCSLWLSAPALAHTHFTPPLQPELVASEKASYLIAKTWFLPDYQGDTSSRSETNNNPGGGDIKGECGTYGLIASCAAPKTPDGKKQVRPDLICYERCICSEEIYPFNSSNCDLSRYKLDGGSCDGLYKTCAPKSCPQGSQISCASNQVRTPNGSYSGNSPCYTCRDKTCADGNLYDQPQTGMICEAQTYASRSCYTCKTDPCYNLQDQTCPYGCQKTYDKCATKCQTCFADNCRNRDAAQIPYGCKSYWSDCASKCQIAYTDNCRNRDDVYAPYGCQQYWGDCSDKCQVPKTETCESQIADNKPNAIVIKDGSAFSSYSMSGKDLVLVGNISISSGNVYIGNNTKIHSAGDFGSKCMAATLDINGGLQLNGNAELNLPVKASVLDIGSGTLTLNKDMTVIGVMTVPAGSTAGVTSVSNKLTAHDIVVRGTLNLASDSNITNQIVLHQGSVLNINGKSHQIRQVALQGKTSGSITKWNLTNAFVNLNYDNSVDDGFYGDTTNAGFQLTATNSTINANGSFSYAPPASGNSKYNLVNSTIARVNYFVVRGAGLIVTFSQNATVSFFNRYGDGSYKGAVGIAPGYSTATSNFNKGVFYFFAEPSDWVGRGSVLQSNLAVK